MTSEQRFDRKTAAHQEMRAIIRRMAERRRKVDATSCATCSGATLECSCGLRICTVCGKKYEITHRHRREHDEWTQNAGESAAG